MSERYTQNGKVRGKCSVCGTEEHAAGTFTKHIEVRELRQAIKQLSKIGE